GWAKREGRWLVPPRVEVRVKSGHITLDITEAVITQPLLHIDADVGSGMLTLLTKPGIAVDADDVAVSSGGVKVRAPWGPDAPVILRIGGAARSRPPSCEARQRPVSAPPISWPASRAARSASGCCAPPVLTSRPRPDPV